MKAKDFEPPRFPSTLGTVDSTIRTGLLLSLQRALLGAVHPQLRQASIEADCAACIVRVRFEYENDPSAHVRESCSVAATEVNADFAAPWKIEEQHISVPSGESLSPLKLVGFLRAEVEHA